MNNPFAIAMSLILMSAALCAADGARDKTRQVRVTPDVNVDGYFTRVPENAKVLLNRTLSGKPA